MNRIVAVKVMHPHLAAQPGFVARLVREAQIAAKLSHNNIVQAIDVGQAGTIHYFVMEYVEGTTIQEELEKGKIYEEQEALEIILQIARALQHAWQRELIHRDVKPANLIITKDNVAKLADLGLARKTEDRAIVQAEKGMAVGTPFYISPEQIEGKEDIDCRADIYSLGATLYHMVTGRPPFPGDKVEEVFEAHLNTSLTPPDHLNEKLSAGFGEVVEYMMAKRRDMRYASPDELILDLECLLRGEAPAVARQGIATAALLKLAHGKTVTAEELEKQKEAEEAAAKEEEEAEERRQTVWWVGILGILLAVSVILNLVQLGVANFFRR
jgi:serine/threonine-protein kinase